MELISTMAQVPLTYGCTVSWEAIDPTTGATITGVVIRDATLYGYPLGGSSVPAVSEVAPAFVPIPVSVLNEGG